MAKQIKITWLSEQGEHDYPAAKSYLKLIYRERTAAEHVEKLRRARISKFKIQRHFQSVTSVAFWALAISTSKRTGKKLNPVSRSHRFF